MAAPDYVALIPSANNKAPKFTAMVEAVTSAWAGVYELLQELPQVFDVDTAVGEQLDIIGLWVGQSRVIDGVLLVQYFGFDNSPAALPYGEERNASIGGRFYNEGEPTTATSVLADPEYRTLIKARIARNNAQGSTAEIVAALQFLFSAPAYVQDPGGMVINVAIGRPLTLVEQAIITGLDILPRPAGVRVNQLGYFNADGYLGFEGQPGALPFAEEGDPGPLGQLMEEF